MGIYSWGSILPKEKKWKGVFFFQIQLHQCGQIKISQRISLMINIQFTLYFYFIKLIFWFWTQCFHHKLILWEVQILFKKRIKNQKVREKWTLNLLKTPIPSSVLMALSIVSLVSALNPANWFLQSLLLKIEAGVKWGKNLRNIRFRVSNECFWYRLRGIFN